MVFKQYKQAEGIRQSLRLLLLQKPPPFAQGRLARSKAFLLMGKRDRLQWMRCAVSRKQHLIRHLSVIHSAALRYRGRSRASRAYHASPPKGGSLFLVRAHLHTTVRQRYVRLQTKTSREETVSRKVFICLFPANRNRYSRSAFISSAFADGFTVISTHAGKNPLLIAFLTDRIFDHAEQ